MSAHVIAAGAAALALLVSAAELWRGLAGAPARARLVYGLVPLTQAAIVAYGAACACAYPDGVAVSYAISVFGLVQAAAVPLLAKGLAAAEGAGLAREYADAVDAQLSAQRRHLARTQAAQAELESTRRVLQGRFADVAARLESGDVVGAREAISATEAAIPSRARICRNAAVNALLNEKLRACDEKGIELTCRIGLGEQTAIPATELCAMLANLIDNAINACSEVAPSVDRRIIVAARETEALLAVKVENPSAGGAGAKRAVRPRAGAVPEHGWGTAIVAALVDRHGGTYAHEAADGLYTAAILIPLK